MKQCILKKALSGGVVMLLVSAAQASTVTVDFSLDDNGLGLGNGQQIDTEFFTNFTVGSGGTGHLGPAIFDSSDPGPNDGGGDPDLLVNLGNIMILQNDSLGTQTTPGFFDTPNDEAGFSPSGMGSIIFDFNSAVELISIDLIDINGGILADVFLTDGNGNTRFYDVPSQWTHDISAAPGTDGYNTLDLQTLLPQAPEAGIPLLTNEVPSPIEDPGFDPFNVVQLEIQYSGSAALDNLVFEDNPIPEPMSLTLLGLGGLVVVRRRR